MEKLFAYYKKGSPVQIGIKIAITILVIYILYQLSKSITGFIQDLFKDSKNERIIGDVLENTQSQDGTIEDESFRPQAQMIAQRQYEAMVGYGTDERNIMEPLEGLTGSELRMVYEEFGSKEGKDLFQWYKDELCSGGPCMMFDYVYHGENSEGCESYLDQCSPLEYVEGLWKKSGLPF